MSISKEFANATQAVARWAALNEERFGATAYSAMEGTLTERDETGSMGVIIGTTPHDVLRAAIKFDRGTPTKNGHKSVDEFELIPGKALVHESGRYSTTLVEFDENHEAIFPKGIGLKRQKLAHNALRLFQDRFNVDE